VGVYIGPSEPQANADAQARRHGRPAGPRPLSFAELLEWFGTHWVEELPDELHKAELWYGRQETRRGEEVWPAELVGGSRLHTHAWSDAARRYLEGNPKETQAGKFNGQDDGQEHFVRPLQAAFSRVLGRADIGDRRDPRAWLARWLVAVAHAGLDWRGVATRAGIPLPVAYVYTDVALRLLHERYRLVE
jgi:hypothetical protein